MATVKRHPVPQDSYQPDRPLNDLMLAQLEHFVDTAKKLPPNLRADLPEPPLMDDHTPPDPAASSRYIAAVTAALLSQRKPAITLVSSRPRRAPARQPAEGLALAAASASKPKAKKSAAKKRAIKTPRKGPAK
jgi:hypothetical protein